MEEFVNEKYIEDSVNPVSIEGIETILYQMKNCVCKIYQKEGSKGTGFFCRIPFPNEENLLPVLITNNHVLGKTDLENDNYIEFSINNEKEYRKIHINKKIELYLLMKH